MTRGLPHCSEAVVAGSSGDHLPWDLHCNDNMAAGEDGRREEEDKDLDAGKEHCMGGWA